MMCENKPAEKRSGMSGGRRAWLLAALLLASVLALAGCNRRDTGGPPVPDGVVVRPTPGGTLAPLPTMALVPAAAASATAPSAPAPGDSAVPSPTPPSAGVANSAPQPPAETQGTATPLPLATMPGPTATAVPLPPATAGAEAP